MPVLGSFRNPAQAMPPVVKKNTGQIWPVVAKVCGAVEAGGPLAVRLRSILPVSQAAWPSTAPTILEDATARLSGAGRAAQEDGPLCCFCRRSRLHPRQGGLQMIPAGALSIPRSPKASAALVAVARVLGSVAANTGFGGL